MSLTQGEVSLFWVVTWDFSLRVYLQLLAAGVSAPPARDDEFG